MVNEPELYSKIISNLAEDAAKFIFGKAKDYFVDREYKEQIDFEYAYEDYLIKVYDEYSKSRTILYDDEPRTLSSFFVPVDLEPATFNYSFTYPDMKIQRTKEKNLSQNHISTKIISDVFQHTNKLIVTGIEGMGKTMLMKHFCANAIEKGYKIPVFISLRRFNEVVIDDKPFEKQIFEQLSIYGFRLEYKYFEYSLSSDKYLFLFDGYDEVSDAKKQSLAIRLNDFAKRYPKNNYIVSSRPADELFGWELFKMFSICRLDRKQTVNLIWKLDFDYEAKKRFINELTQKLYYRYESFASVPLLLSILFLTYVTNTQLPETLNEFYEKAFETLCFKYDRMKIGFERVFKSGLTYEAFRNVFICFCFISYFKEMYSFSYRSLVDTLSIVSQKMKKEFDEDAVIDDITEISCMLLHEGQEYFFLHRSFQEYFAAVYVAKKPDEEQVTLCSSYIDYKNNEKPFDDIRTTTILMARKYNSLSFGIKEVHQGLDFFVMLESVEPDRFENIVLVPIMKKVYDVYRDNNNLLITTSMCSETFRTLLCSLDPHIRNEYLVDRKENPAALGVLKCFFNTDLDESEIEKIENESLKQQISRNAIIDSFIQYAERFPTADLVNGKEKDLRGILEKQEIQEGYFRINSSEKQKMEIMINFNNIRALYTFYCIELWFMALVIDRYEKISQKKNHGKSFDDLLMDFI